MKKLKVAVFIQIILLISVLSSCQTIDKKMSISSFDKDCKEIKETYNFESSDSLKFVFLNCLSDSLYDYGIKTCFDTATNPQVKIHNKVKKAILEYTSKNNISFNDIFKEYDKINEKNFLPMGIAAPKICGIIKIIDSIKNKESIKSDSFFLKKKIKKNHI